jgi:hypothetical protein
MLHSLDKIPDKTTQGKKDLFGLTVSEGSVHGLLVPALEQNIMKAGVCGKGSYSPHGDQEAEKNRKGPRTRYSLQRHIPSDLPPLRTHLLKHLELFKIEPSTGEPHIQHISLPRKFHVQTIISLERNIRKGDISWINSMT